MTLAVLSATATAQAVGGAGSFLDAFDALYALVNSGATNVTLGTVVGGVGAREFMEIIVPNLANMRIVVAGKAAGNPQMQAPDTFLANAFHVGLAKGLSDIPAYTNPWDVGALNPYGAAQYIPLSRCSAAAGNFSEVICIETDDTCSIWFRTATNAFYGFHAGRIFEPRFVNAAESDGGLYGYITGGAAAMATDFASNSGGVLTKHTATNNNPHVYMFEPGLATVAAVDRDQNQWNANWNPEDSEGNESYPALTYHRFVAPYTGGIRLREIYVAKGQWREAKQVGGINTHYIMAGSATTDVDALAFLI